MMPFTGKAHVAYMPVERVVGLSKLARLVDVYARRLQTQEHLNAQVATAIDEILKPRGVAVMIEAEHTCMSLRGVEKPGALDGDDAIPRPVPRRSERAGAVHHVGARQPALASCQHGRASGLPIHVGSLRFAHCACRESDRTSKKACVLAPKFDADGLVTCVATDAASGDVLMVAHMNAQALKRTIETGEAWYYSRSRQALWKKGETSGHAQRVVEMRVDCDQDAIWIKVEQDGPGACHTGRRSCFYRAVIPGTPRRRRSNFATPNALRSCAGVRPGRYAVGQFTRRWPIGPSRWWVYCRDPRTT